jgi:selenocysteine lyase/cysteine desulfurase
LAGIDFPKLEPAPDIGPERAETGTQNHEGICGAAAAVDFLASLAPGKTRRERLERAFASLQRRGGQLVRQLWEGLNAIAGVRTYGPPLDERRTPTVAFTVAQTQSREVARALADRAVFVSDGDFYAATVMERLGLAPDGVVRAGCACYTTQEEVQRLVDGVRALARP